MARYLLDTNVLVYSVDERELESQKRERAIGVLTRVGRPGPSGPSAVVPAQALAEFSRVAMGRLDGFYEALKPWDFAAAALIAREAGARIGHLGPVEGDIPEELYGKDLVVTAPGIYEDLVALLRPTAMN